jgi:iron-sulfur cluster assembly protein
MFVKKIMKTTINLFTSIALLLATMNSTAQNRVSIDNETSTLNWTVKVSESAKQKVSVLMQEEGFDPINDFVRVGVKSGGCSGLSYDLNFDKNQLDEDRLFEDNNVKIVVDKKSLLYLLGTTLEYSGGLNGKGFVFNNPNANRTCGCGESFSL